MQIVYKEVIILKARKVLVYCPRRQPLNLFPSLFHPVIPSGREFIWLAQIQTQRIVERWYNLDLIKSHFFTEVTSSAEESSP